MGAPTVAPGAECPVCFDEMKDEKQLFETICHHIFHRACLEQWLLREDTCPGCRKDDPLGQRAIIGESSSAVSLQESEQDPEDSPREQECESAPLLPEPAPVPPPVAPPSGRRRRRRKINPCQVCIVL